MTPPRSPTRSRACWAIERCGPNAGEPHVFLSKAIVTGRQTFYVTNRFTSDCCAAPEGDPLDMKQDGPAGRWIWDDMEEASENRVKAVSAALLRASQPAIPALIGAAALTFLDRTSTRLHSSH